MRDIIYGILVRLYSRLYGYDQCDWMADHIADKINAGEFTTKQDIKMYVWYQTSGGGVAELAAQRIHEALPHLISDETVETRNK